MVTRAGRAAGCGTGPGRFQADSERLADVRALAEHLLSTYPEIDVRPTNAGMVTMSRRRRPDVLSLDLHPGPVRTDIGRDTALRFVCRYAPFLISPAAVARPDGR